MNEDIERFCKTFSVFFGYPVGGTSTLKSMYEMIRGESSIEEILNLLEVLKKEGRPLPSALDLKRELKKSKDMMANRIAQDQIRPTESCPYCFGTGWVKVLVCSYRESRLVANNAMVAPILKSFMDCHFVPRCVCTHNIDSIFVWDEPEAICFIEACDRLKRGQ